MTIDRLLLALLAVYRLTLMLNAEAGPGDLFGRLRARLGVRYDEHSNPYGTNWVAEGVLCFYCLSVWVAFAVTALLAIGWLVGRIEAAEMLLLPFSMSGAAIFLKKWGG